MKFLKFWGKKKEPQVQSVKKLEESKSEEEFPKISLEEREKYTGKHIVIAGGKIVASAKSAKEAWTKARKKYDAGEIELRYVGSKNLLMKCRCLKKRESKA